MTSSVNQPLIGIPAWSDHSQFYSGVSLYGMNQSYVNTLQKAGALPILIPLDLDQNNLRGIFQRLDGLFLAGGGDIAPRIYNRRSRKVMDSSDIERDITELILATWAIEANMPILGVCRGMQIINIAYGGTLYEDLRNQRPDLARHDYIGPMYKRDQISHKVSIEPESYLAQILDDEAGVNSMHHQGVAEVGDGLSVTAVSTDGLVEALEAQSRAFVLGTQWHPEELMKSDPRHEAVFRDFLSAASDDWRRLN